MEFLRITAATTGIKTYIPDNYVVNIVVSADTLDTGSNIRAPQAVRGIITAVKYLDGAAAAAPTVISAAVAAYAGTGTARYEYGSFTFDGAFCAALTN